jgi:antitoxin component of RelBE/YafQ-DinJ toxin-antitoxin module
MAKLTLSVDPVVVSRARVYAKQHGVSISRMVETYLNAVAATASGPVTKSTPILDSLTGILRGADVNDHRRYLEEKYR